MYENHLPLVSLLIKIYSYQRICPWMYGIRGMQEQLPRLVPIETKPKLKNIDDLGMGSGYKHAGTTILFIYTIFSTTPI